MRIQKDDIIKHIKKIRKEIGHDDSDINIQKLIFNDKNNELWIITPGRPDKSAIIGKGGWVIGRLKEETNLNKIHVENYSDFLLKEYQMKLSLEKINSFLKENSKNNSTYNQRNNQTNHRLNNHLLITPLKNLIFLLEEKINNIYSFDLESYFTNITNENKKKHGAVVALSGGIDSSFSLILAKKLGFNPIAITIDPGTIILPKQFKDNIKKLCDKINVKQKYISVNFNEIITDSLNGRLHPCGRCSSMIESTIFNYATNNNIDIVIFGDMLSTGLQCITKQIFTPKNDKYCKTNEININDLSNDNNINSPNNNTKKVYRLNLPATLSISKEEMKNIVFKYNLEKIKGFGCPLLYETHKKYPHLKKFSVQRILRETRAGALESGEALDLIWSFYKLK